MSLTSMGDLVGKIGQNVHICDSVKLGENVTVGYNTIIYDNVEIGDDCFIGPNCILGEPHDGAIGNSVAICYY